MQVAGAAEPVVSIQSVNEITQTTARVYGLLTLEGGISVSDYGICYAATALPTINNSKVSRGGSSSSQSFDCLLSGLTEGSEYHARAYAVSNGRTYYSADKTFTTASGSGGGQGSEDYSSAIVSSDNRKVTVNLVSCYRNGNRVKIEATIRNSGVTASNNYYIYQNNYGYTVGGYTYNTYVEDDIYTTYNNYAVTVDLNNKSGNSGFYTQLPLNSTKKMTVYVDGVPKDARTVSVYLATEFRDSDPREYAYLTFGNVPIY
jgi:hypothetical protein